MGIGHDAIAAFGKALSSVHAGVDKLALRKLDGPGIGLLEVASAAFRAGDPLPSWATGETPPPLSWSPPPIETRSMAVIVEDPDAPLVNPFVHWLVWAIPPTMRELDLTSANYFRQGRNSNLRPGYTACSPPPGHGVHHYHFQVFALDVLVDLPAGEGRRALLEAMRGHVLARGDVVGTNRKL
jgi:Raf kinase inhibitor-like YbhB/YbcL family protein